MLTTTWFKRHPMSMYLVLAYAISWIVAVPLALQAQRITHTHLPFTLHYLMAFGPALAARTTASLLHEPLGGTQRKTKQSRLRRSLWWIIGLGSPLPMFAVAQLAARAAGQNAPSWHDLGRVNFLPELGFTAWWLWFATNGLGEEPGWRGFLLPRLQQRHSPIVSTVLLTIGWAGWHVPAFFYLPSYAAMGLSIVPGFFFGLFAGAIVLTWLYNRSGGSVLAAAFWHASFNFVTASPAAGGFTAAVVSMLVVAWAVVVLVSGGLRPLLRLDEHDVRPPSSQVQGRPTE
jgi:CAAX protease family protein